MLIWGVLSFQGPAAKLDYATNSQLSPCATPHTQQAFQQKLIDENIWQSPKADKNNFNPAVQNEQILRLELCLWPGIETLS